MGNCQAVCLKDNTDANTMNLNDPQPQSISKNKDASHGHHKHHKHGDVADQSQTEESEEEEYDDQYQLEQIKKKAEKGGHRTISAEAYGQYNKKGDFKAKVIPKTEQQKQRIKERLEKAFMFSALDDKEKTIVIDAMIEKKFKPDEYVIKQGEYGDHLYVVDSGALDCYKKFKPTENDTYLKTYQPGESFGELALLYNCPRAASIKAKVESVAYELDRETFNNIVKDSAVKKRERYDEFLSKVEILKGMDPYERSKIGDVLKTVKFRNGDYIIKQGENGDTFYFIEDGTAVAAKKETPNGPEKEVYNYKAGDFFGELALRNNAPRQASVIAKSEITLAVIDRESFKRVLGPVEALLAKQQSKYVGYNK
jgi:cAMP-dependent protein kinase regulator